MNDDEILKLLDSMDKHCPENINIYSFTILKISDDHTFLDQLIKYQNFLSIEIFNRLLKIDDNLKEPLIGVINNNIIDLLLKLSLNPSLRAKYLLSIPNELLENFMFTQNEELIIRILPYIKNQKDAFTLASRLKSDSYITSSLHNMFTRENSLTLITKIKNIDLIKELINKYMFTPYEVFNAFNKIEDENIRIRIATELFDVKTLNYKNKYKILKTTDFLPEELKFGIEIECIGEKSYGIRLYNNKIFDYDVKEELSIPSKGIEFSSKKLSWNSQDLASVYQICDYASLNSLETDFRCGGHIHFSSDFLKTYDAWFWFLYLYSKFEFLLYIISNEAGSLPRDEILNYAKPFSGRYVNNLWRLHDLHSTKDFINNLKKISEKKSMGVNFHNIFERFNTIEFRMPNSSLKPYIILENVLLFGNLLTMAKKLSILPLTREIYSLLKELDQTTDYRNVLDIMLKLLFKDENLRKSFKHRFDLNYKLYLSKLYPNDLITDSKSFSYRKTGIII